MIDTKQSFRKGKVIVEVHVGEIQAPCQHCNELETHLEGCIMRLIHGDAVPLVQEITKAPTEYNSINAAKKANRLTKYRTVPVKAGAK